MPALETELRKSKRAEQKLQALLFRLRQDVAELQANPSLFDQLQDVRSLEYEVDFLTNKCKASPSFESSMLVCCMFCVLHIDDHRRSEMRSTIHEGGCL